MENNSLHPLHCALIYYFDIEIYRTESFGVQNDDMINSLGQTPQPVEASELGRNFEANFSTSLFFEVPLCLV